MASKLTNDEFIKRIDSISDCKISILGKYDGINRKVLCKCNVCGNEWEATPSHLLYRKQGCKKCKAKLVWNERKDRTTKESLVKRIHEIFPQYNLSLINETVKTQKEPITII